MPRELLGDIYRLLADAPTTPTPPVDSDPGADALPDPDDVEWSGSSDARFRDPRFVAAHLATRSDTVREAAKYLAQRPGTWTTSEEIASALGLEHGWNSLAGAFGAAGRYFANRDIALPWDWTYDTPDRRIRLKMESDIADVILKVL